MSPEAVPLFSQEYFNQISLRVQSTRNLIKQKIQSEEVTHRLYQLLTKIEKVVTDSLLALESAGNTISVDSMLETDMSEIKRSVEKEKQAAARGEPPYLNKLEGVYAFNFLSSLHMNRPSQIKPDEKPWQAYALEIEQDLLNTSEKISIDFKNLLQEVSKLTEGDTCFIVDPFVHKTYAKPEASYEFWVIPFLQKLKENLETCGINISMDVGDYEGMTRESWLEKNISVSSSVIVVGSMALAKRNKEGDEGVRAELALIKNIRKQSNPSFLIPVLLAGSIESSFPSGFTDAVVNAVDQLGNRLSYLKLLKCLLEEIFDPPKSTESEARKAWDLLWSTFAEKHPEFEDGISKEAVEAQILENKKFIELQKAIHFQNSVKMVEEYTQKTTLEASEALGLQIKRDLQKFYRKKNTIKRLIAAPLPIEKHYTKLMMVTQSEQRSKDFESVGHKSFPDLRLNSWEDIHRPKGAISLDDIFDEQKETHRVLILGRAGIGKSTLCHYMAYQWASHSLWNKQFQALFWVPLRSIIHVSQHDTIYSVIEKYCIENGEHKTSSEHIKEFIEQNSDKVLFVLDGYDEISSSIGDDTVIGRLVQQFLKQKNWVLTSRPYAAFDLPSVHQVDLVLENIGFDSDGIVQYIYQFFEEPAKTQHSVDTSSFGFDAPPLPAPPPILEKIEKNPLLFGSAHIPLNLELICSFWASKHKRKSRIKDFAALNLTELYEELSLNLQRRFYIRQGYEDAFDWDEFDFEEQTAYIPTIQSLEEMAWVNLSQKDIIFSPKQKEIRNIMNKHRRSLNQSETRQWMENIQQFGILNSSGENRGFRNNEYYFIHLSFQEFFAAKYLARLFIETPSQAKNFVLKHKSNPRYQVVWWFLAGLLQEEKDVLVDYLDLVFESELLSNIPSLDEKDYQDFIHPAVVGSSSNRLKDIDWISLYKSQKTEKETFLVSTYESIRKTQIRCLGESKIDVPESKQHEYLEELNVFVDQVLRSGGHFIDTLMDEIEIYPKKIKSSVLSFLAEKLKEPGDLDFWSMNPTVTSLLEQQAKEMGNMIDMNLDQAKNSTEVLLSSEVFRSGGVVSRAANLSIGQILTAFPDLVQICSEKMTEKTSKELTNLKKSRKERNETLFNQKYQKEQRQKLLHQLRGTEEEFWEEKGSSYLEVPKTDAGHIAALLDQEKELLFSLQDAIRWSQHIFGSFIESVFLVIEDEYWRFGVLSYPPLLRTLHLLKKRPKLLQEFIPVVVHVLVSYPINFKVLDVNNVDYFQLKFYERCARTRTYSNDIFYYDYSSFARSFCDKILQLIQSKQGLDRSQLFQILIMPLIEENFSPQVLADKSHNDYMFSEYNRTWINATWFGLISDLEKIEDIRASFFRNTPPLNGGKLSFLMAIECIACSFLPISPPSKEMCFKYHQSFSAPVISLSDGFKSFDYFDLLAVLIVQVDQNIWKKFLRCTSIRGVKRKRDCIAVLVKMCKEELGAGTVVRARSAKKSIEKHLPTMVDRIVKRQTWLEGLRKLTNKWIEAENPEERLEIKPSSEESTLMLNHLIKMAQNDPGLATPISEDLARFFDDNYALTSMQFSPMCKVMPALVSIEKIRKSQGSEKPNKLFLLSIMTTAHSLIQSHSHSSLKQFACRKLLDICREVSELYPDCILSERQFNNRSLIELFEDYPTSYQEVFNDSQSSDYSNINSDNPIFTLYRKRMEFL